MTIKEFFIKTLNEETKRFRDVLEALPDDKFDYKVHDKSRTAGNIAAQLALQWEAISGVVKNGIPAFNSEGMQSAMKNKENMLIIFDKGMSELKKDMGEISEEDWENGKAEFDMGQGKKWQDTKLGMSWSFLFDAIHHRGQLSTYLRAMDAKVPSIYGPSADTK